MSSERVIENDEESVDNNETSGTEQVKEQRKTLECNECGGDLRKNEKRGELVCVDCGLVADDQHIDRGPEWRTFSSDDMDSKSRVGAPMTKMLHDKGLSTNIDWRDKDAYGNNLSSRQREKMHRLRKWNERYRTQGHQDRNLKLALSEISRMSSALGLNDQVQETASALYRQCLEKNMIVGRSIEGMASACLYAASRQCKTPRSLDEIYPVSRLSNDQSIEIDRAYRYIVEELELPMEPVDPKQYLNRFLNDLDIHPEKRTAMQQQAEKLLDATEEQNLHSGRAPTSLAAASIYAAGLLEKAGLTQTEVANVSDTTQVTIRKRYKEMLEAAGIPY